MDTESENELHVAARKGNTKIVMLLLQDPLCTSVDATNKVIVTSMIYISISLILFKSPYGGIAWMQRITSCSHEWTHRDRTDTVARSEDNRRQRCG